MGRPLTEADDETEAAGADASCLLHPETKMAGTIRAASKNQDTACLFILNSSKKYF
jgi:hypothetical protein